MQSETPAGADVVEVRDTLKLPLGMVSLDGRLYFLQRVEEGLASDRRVATVQIHSASRFKPTPFAGLSGDGRQRSSQLEHLMPASDIFTAKHTPALLRLFDNRRPRMTLLFSGKRDGMTAADFHRRCDGRGPTLTVIRTHIPDGAADSGCIIGGWAGESWVSHGSHKDSPTWLYSLGSASSNPPVVSKYRPTSEQCGLICSSHYGPTFGAFGGGLRVHFESQQNIAVLLGYELIDGYAAAPLPLGGADRWDVESIEVWSCAL